MQVEVILKFEEMCLEIKATTEFAPLFARVCVLLLNRFKHEFETYVIIVFINVVVDSGVPVRRRGPDRRRHTSMGDRERRSRGI